MADYLGIKPDPDTKVGTSPSAFDEDLYEDTGDLEFNPDPNSQRMYMAKVPKYLWEQWSKLDDDAEIQIGTVRQINMLDPKGQPKMELELLLSSDLAVHQAIPKEYQLEITAESVRNTFIFTEQDLPGFKSRSREKFDIASANMPARLTRPSKVEKPKQAWDPNQKFTPYFRKAVPKRTTIAGRVAHEVNCVAVPNEETRHLLAVMTKEAMQPKHMTKFINEDLASGHTGYVQPGTFGAMNAMRGFIKTINAPGHKPLQQKTARMPQNELLDRIFECFRKYNYWSMKALRAELQQPEAYLRETLDKVAILAKSGRFATQWSLKPENKLDNYGDIGDDVAPENDFPSSPSDDDDEDVRFEDV